jgi:uncharacterized repeat protein (TIGR01451 family)
MMRISTFKNTARRFFGALLMMLFTALMAKAQLGISIMPTGNAAPGEMVTAEVLVYNFTDILSMQFSLNWDAEELEFVSVGNFGLPGLTAGNFNLIPSPTGKLSFSWNDPNSVGVLVDNCNSIFSINFISTHGNFPPLSLINDPTQIEVINANIEELTLLQNLGCSDLTPLSGLVFNDLDEDCLLGPNETGLNNWKVKFEGDSATFYRNTKADGTYNIFLPAGQYEASLVLPPNGLWAPCTPTTQLNIVENEPATLDFPAQALLDCPAMTLDLSAPFLRRCFDSNYQVHYCNDGTVTAEGAYIEITFDPYLEVQSSSIPWSAVDGQTYTFPLGDVGINECGSFQVKVLVSCDAVLGQTHCSEAHIFPNTSCIPASPLWDGSDLEVTATCDGDFVHFQITNTGDDMAEPVEFIVIEDDMVYLQGQTIQLAQLESDEISVAANGSTWRLEAAENAHHPLSSFAAAVVEGCGTNGNGTFSLGFVNQFPVNDGGPTTDEDCRENVGSYDPNDKLAIPEGFCESHFIKSNTDIEYMIRFQNTGTDTAFTVVVTDTLSPLLDPASVIPGASSHPYQFDLLGNGVLQFTFEDIMLPDSNVNEAASNGFVQFKISQIGGTQAGDLILNKAAIVFDFNDPIVTNEYFHTVGDEFVEGAAQNGNLSISGFVKTWYGEPLENVEMSLTDICPVYTDENGYYVFNNLDTGNYALQAGLQNTSPYEGVTVLDMLKLRSRILGISPLNKYQSLAADINLSNSISTYDMVVMKDLILRKPLNNFPPIWTFVTTDSILLPANYSYNLLVNNLENQDFFGIKKGDLIDESMVDISNNSPTFIFESNQATIDTILVNIKANNNDSLVAYQMGIQWDPSVLEFIDMEPGLLLSFAEPNYYLHEPGKLSVFQFGNEKLSDTTLCTLKFLAIGGVGSSTPLELDETHLPFQVVVEDCKLAGASLQNAMVTIADPSAIVTVNAANLNMQIAPNPSLAGQAITAEISSSEETEIRFSVFDMQGSLIWENIKQIPAGLSGIRLAPGLSKGMYLLHINDTKGNSSILKLSVL